MMHQKAVSSLTALSFTVAVCSLLLLIGTIGECHILLELWMVWTVLFFGATIFAVFDLDFEKNSFVEDSLIINISIALGEKNK